MTPKPYKGDIYRPQLPTSLKDGIEYPNQIMIQIWALNEKETVLLAESMGYTYSFFTITEYSSIWEPGYKITSPDICN